MEVVFGGKKCFSLRWYSWMSSMVWRDYI